MCHYVPPCQTSVLVSQVIGHLRRVASLQAVAKAHRLATVVASLYMVGETREHTEPFGGKFVGAGISAEGEAWYVRAHDRQGTPAGTANPRQNIAEPEVAINIVGVPGRPYRGLLDGRHGLD